MKKLSKKSIEKIINYLFEKNKIETNDTTRKKRNK